MRFVKPLSCSLSTAAVACILKRRAGCVRPAIDAADRAQRTGPFARAALASSFAARETRKSKGSTTVLFIWAKVPAAHLLQSSQLQSPQKQGAQTCS
jgi:hypothetical protein